jgi:hypothetical protein
MIEVGQRVKTKYGDGTVICVGSVKPHVYVRMHTRSNAIYIMKIGDVTGVDTTDFNSQARAEAGESKHP